MGETRHRRRPTSAAVLVAVAVALTAIALVVTVVVVAGRDRPGDEPTVVPPERARPTEAVRPPTTTTTNTTLPTTPAEDGLRIAPPLARPYATSFLVADAVGPSVPLFSAPDVPVPSGRTLDNPTWEGLPLTFLVRERRADWLHAQIMGRPNSALAWVRRSDVTLRRVANHVLVEREARRLTVMHGDEVLFQTSVATGKASSPTPLGTFFVDGVVPLDPPHRAYGVGQVSFTGFSEVYESFGGGVGQVALHGTQNPALIGTPASNGCVRMRNEDITRVMELAPTGTPVEVIG